MTQIRPEPSTAHVPRLVVYHQTHHRDPGDEQGQQTPVSILPLLSNNCGVTHIIVAAVHLNDGDNLTLNDDPDTAPKYDQLWTEVAVAQASGVKVLAMLGGAAKGSFARLCGDETSVSHSPCPSIAHSDPPPSPSNFEFYFTQLHRFLRRHSLDGIDLDVEEETPLAGITRLVDRLRATFPPSFLITLAPVLPALFPAGRHLSGFSYFDLESLRRSSIDWYNAQLYCGWGDAGDPDHYFWAVRGGGWDPRRVVLGTVSNPDNGAGWVEPSRLGEVVAALRRALWGFAGLPGDGFGGVACWEYFNALPGGEERPWEWAGMVGAMLSADVGADPGMGRGVVAAAAAAGGQTEPPPTAQIPFPAESVKTLEELGFTRLQAVAALNRTGGNVEYAAGLLFES